MIYLIYGTDDYLRNKEVKKITSLFDQTSINKFDLNQDSLKIVLDDADTNSLFSNSKVLIINNSFIFSAKKNDIEHDLSELEKYFTNPNPDATLIFILDYEKLDERKKITKRVKEIGKIIVCNPLKDIKPIVKEMFGNLKISNSSIELLISRVGTNLSLIEKEVCKLKSYVSSEVTDEDILNVTSKNSEPDIFAFIEAIVNKDIKKSYLIYQDLIVVNEEAIKVIVMLSNQFRLIYQSKLLLERGFDLDHIASTLDIHPYRVKLAIQNGRKYEAHVLLDFIRELADMDYKIKIGEVDKNLAFEMFILKI